MGILSERFLGCVCGGNSDGNIGSLVVCVCGGGGIVMAILSERRIVMGILSERFLLSERPALVVCVCGE